MAKRKYLYGHRKQKDIQDFDKAINELSKLFEKTGKGNRKVLADKFNVSTSTLKKWETGKSKPNDENFEKVLRSYSSFKPTIKDPKKTEKFIEKTQKKRAIEKKKNDENKLIITNANKWLDKNFHNRYKDAQKYEYFRGLINEKGFDFVGYYKSNPKEGIFLKTKKQEIIKENFMYMIGTSHNYPYESKDEQMFIRRLPRLATGIRDLKNVRADTEKARKIFYSGENADKLENFIGYYFDS